MNRFGVTLFWFSVLTGSAAAENFIEPGQWKVTSGITVNGNTLQPQTKARCLTPEQTDDLVKTFSPVMGSVNSTCERTEYEAAGRKLKWHLQCKGVLDMDVLGNFDFDTPSHYTAIILTKGWMSGSLTSDVKAELEGERVGECQQ